jgi:hypothetical protein
MAAPVPVGARVFVCRGTHRRKSDGIFLGNHALSCSPTPDMFRARDPLEWSGYPVARGSIRRRCIPGSMHILRWRCFLVPANHRVGHCRSCCALCVGVFKRRPQSHPCSKIPDCNPGRICATTLSGYSLSCVCNPDLCDARSRCADPYGTIGLYCDIAGAGPCRERDAPASVDEGIPGRVISLFLVPEQSVWGIGNTPCYGCNTSSSKAPVKRSICASPKYRAHPRYLTGVQMSR